MLQSDKIKQIILLLIVLNSLLYSDEYRIFEKDNSIEILYQNKIIKIESFDPVSGFDCMMYTKVDKEFYSLPDEIQQKAWNKAKEKYIINDNYNADILKKEIFLWDDECLEANYFHPSGIRGIYALSNEKMSLIVTKKLKNTLHIKESKDMNLTLYTYKDKLGLHYILIYKYTFKPTYQKIIKVFSFQKKNKKIVVDWKLKDFSDTDEDVYIHMDRNFQDLDKDGVVDPIISYRINDEIKILIMYKNKKVGIRSHDVKNLLLSKDAKILIDKSFYKLPKSIQTKAFQKLKNMLHFAGARFLNYEKALKNKTLILKPDPKLIDREL